MEVIWRKREYWGLFERTRTLSVASKAGSVQNLRRKALAPPEGFEPSTYCLEGSRSVP
jgi:hypothetical protein